ncbi:Transposase IS4 [Popillia japonica]|uniref:Transposase IS4 n=1 Tax=Popillia japonica TaxID=7064 RepID=A0AAW1KJ59_POPJA
MTPKCVTDYNSAKKGVDYSDQMSSYHTMLRKSIKWYRKLMFELLLGTTVVNSLIIYNMVSSIKLGITEFRRQLTEPLVEVTIVQDLG